VTSVDAIDFAIYRYLSPDGAARFWGGRRVIDPRVGAREISSRVGLSETAVRSRLRSLRERGYLADSAVWPNPSLFGASLYRVEIPIEEVGASRALLDDLALVEGVTFARDVLDERDRTLQVYFVGDSPAVVARRAGLLRRLAGGAELRGPRPYYIPAASRELSPLDWRVVEGVRRSPDASLQELSETVGISLKTTAARYRGLLDDTCVWWTHGAVSSEFPLALLTATTVPGSDPVALASEVSATASGWLPVSEDGLGADPAEARTEFGGLLLAESPAAVEAAAQGLLDRRGVERVRRTFALGSRIYPGWFDDQIARRKRAAR
jgi:DNA-binding Lrp family transcriptional regulator